MRKQRTHYNKAFKENAVKLSFERKNVSELAHKLGVEPLLIFSFMKDNKSIRWTIEGCVEF